MQKIFCNEKQHRTNGAVFIYFTISSRILSCRQAFPPHPLSVFPTTLRWIFRLNDQRSAKWCECCLPHTCGKFSHKQALPPHAQIPDVPLHFPLTQAFCLHSAPLFWQDSVQKRLRPFPVHIKVRSIPRASR